MLNKNFEMPTNYLSPVLIPRANTETWIKCNAYYFPFLCKVKLALDVYPLSSTRLIKPSLES